MLTTKASLMNIYSTQRKGFDVVISYLQGFPEVPDMFPSSPHILSKQPFKVNLTWKSSR